MHPAPWKQRFKTRSPGLVVKTVEYRVLGDCLQLLRSCLEAWVKGHLLSSSSFNERMMPASVDPPRVTEHHDDPDLPRLPDSET